MKDYSQNFILTQKLHFEENGPSEGTLTLNEIETMFSQLAQQSHLKLSADSAIAMSIFVLSTRFPTVKKMAVEGKSLALLLAGYFLRRRKFSILK